MYSITIFYLSEHSVSGIIIDNSWHWFTGGIKCVHFEKVRFGINFSDGVIITAKSFDESKQSTLSLISDLVPIDNLKFLIEN